MHVYTTAKTLTQQAWDTVTNRKRFGEKTGKEREVARCKIISEPECKITSKYACAYLAFCEGPQILILLRFHLFVL